MKTAATWAEVDKIRHEVVDNFFSDAESVEDLTTMELTTEKEIIEDMIVYLQFEVENLSE
jgi:hypothetical protein